MLYLLFQLGDERYVLEARQVIEVLPLVAVRDIPQAPRGVAGVFNYRGAPVPLIDLSALAIGRPAQRWLSTRIVLVRDGEQLLGLLAERVTETVRREPSDFVASPVEAAAAPYLGAVATDEHGLIQRIELEKLLSGTLRAALSGEPLVSSAS
jgi:chemotaxis-related protein WspB